MPFGNSRLAMTNIREQPCFKPVPDTPDNICRAPQFAGMRSLSLRGVVFALAESIWPPALTDVNMTSNIMQVHDIRVVLSKYFQDLLVVLADEMLDLKKVGAQANVLYTVMVVDTFIYIVRVESMPLGTERHSILVALHT